MRLRLIFTISILVVKCPHVKKLACSSARGVNEVINNTEKMKVQYSFAISRIACALLDSAPDISARQSPHTAQLPGMRARREAHARMSFKRELIGVKLQCVCASTCFSRHLPLMYHYKSVEPPPLHPITDAKRPADI